MALKFRDVVTSVDELMGVKAVWGRSAAPVMCFGSRGNEDLRDNKHFTVGKSTATRSQVSPFLVTIGGGDQVPPPLHGRAIELVRVTGAFGETNAFVLDPDLRARLAQWPVAVMLSEVYSIATEPHLINDLGFPDRKILSNAFDAVRRDDERVVQLYERLADTEVQRRWDIRTPTGFIDPKKVILVGTMYPRVANPSGREGQTRWKMNKARERDRNVRREVLRLNREMNSGLLVCEGCSLSGTVSTLFDVHHRLPLAAGDRTTHPTDLVVLCPNCHRCCHALGEDHLNPVPIEELALTINGAYSVLADKS